MIPCIWYKEDATFLSRLQNKKYHYAYSGLPIERTGPDQNTWAKIHKHITENPSRLCEPVRSANMKKSITTKKSTNQIISESAPIMDALFTKN